METSKKLTTLILLRGPYALILLDMATRRAKGSRSQAPLPFFRSLCLCIALTLPPRVTALLSQYLEEHGEHVEDTI